MRRNISYFVVSFGIICVFAFMFTVFRSFNTSYAINTGVDRSGVPTSTFTSNVTNDNKVNYISDVLTANGQSNSNSSLFDVKIMKTNNNATPLYSLMKNLEIPKTSEQFEILDDNPTSVTNKGILYILAHGYNTTNTNYNIFSTGTYGSVTNNDIKQYITQIALWLYIYENSSSFASTYCANDGCKFLNSAGTSISSTEVRNIIKLSGSFSNYTYLNYITLLVDNAKSYTGGTTSKISALENGALSYQINNEFTLLTTDSISVGVDSNKVNFMYYSLEIKDPNGYGAYITDSNGDKINNTNIMSGSFKVAVPLKEDLSEMDLSSIEVDVYGHFVKDEGWDYRVTNTNSENSLINSSKNQRYTNVLLGYTPNEVVSTSFKLYNFVKISKIDATNSKELPGATLEITKKDDPSKKEKWVSTNQPHYTYLDNGDYTLCETIAPTGYALNTECIEFTIDGKQIKAVEMKNEPTVPVPDTGKSSSKLLYLAGGSLIIIGLIGFLLSRNNGKNILTQKKKES